MLRVAALAVAAVLGSVFTAALTDRTADRDPILDALDIGFAQDMSAHHQQAVTMTDMLAANTAPDVRAIAEQIRYTQLHEIGQMTGWLQLAEAAPSAATPMSWMHGSHDTAETHHSAHTTAMPGMASPAELTRLQNATGVTQENLFLQLMTRHHQGGIDMAGHAVVHSTTDVIRRAAAVMVDDQTQDIHVMTVLLAQRHQKPMPYP